MQYLKNTTRLHDRKYVMIEHQISPPTREASWWQFKIPEYFPQPSHKHELGDNKLRSQEQKLFSAHYQTFSANGTASGPHTMHALAL